MQKCIDNDFPCENPDYSAFDKVAKTELLNPASASDIVNKSRYCSPVPTDASFVIGDMTHQKYLKPMKGKFGIYHLWIEHDNCDDHETRTMKCIYVGKGLSQERIAAHIKKKNCLKVVSLYVTFYECENRLAKYYEQLFLETYNFILNKSENTGVKDLYAVWDEERFRTGTHLGEISSYSKMEDSDDW